jgi:hypothetical protein
LKVRSGIWGCLPVAKGQGKIFEAGVAVALGALNRAAWALQHEAAWRCGIVIDMNICSLIVISAL